MHLMHAKANLDSPAWNDTALTIAALPQEMNDADVRTRFLQIWMTPDQRGHKPQYGSSEYQKADRHNKLLHLLGGTGQVPDWDNVQNGAGIVLHQVCHHDVDLLLCTDARLCWNVLCGDITLVGCADELL